MVDPIKQYAPLDLTDENKIINMGDPSDLQDATTKSYVDTAIAEAVGPLQSPLTLPGDMLVRGAIGADVALGATPSSSAGTAANINDGNDTTYCEVSWSGGWVKLDLGSSLPISGWRLVESGQIHHHDLQWSEDEINWTTFYSEGGALGTDRDSGIVVISGDPILARYWRTIKREAWGSFWRINTFSLFGPSVPTRLPIGVEEDVLQVVAGMPVWGPGGGGGSGNLDGGGPGSDYGGISTLDAGGV